MDSRYLLAAKAVLGLAAIAWLVFGHRLAERRRNRLLIALGIVSALAYPNFLTAHGNRFVHAWEQFHYVLGTKYFPELGYYGLYEAGFVASRRIRPDQPMPTLLRDLRTGRLVSVADAWIREDEVLAPFSRPRLESFEHDLGVMVDAMPENQLIRILRDHGYNGTPTFTFVAQAVERVVPVTPVGLRVFAAVDLVLLALLFAAVGHVFGRTKLLLSLVVLGTGLTFDYLWNGGAFLRMDWLVATGLAVCALERRRTALAGALFAYAAMVRLFPLLFAVAAAVPWVFALRSREARKALSGYALAFVATASLLFAAGATVGRGLSAWTEFGARIRDHSATMLSNNVGLGAVVTVDTAVEQASDFDRASEDPWLRYAEAMNASAHARRPIVLVLACLLLVVVVIAIRTMEPWRAAIHGAILVFGFTNPTCYYWILLVLLPLAAPPSVIASTIAALLVPAWFRFAGVNGDVPIYLTTSFAFLLVFAQWLASDLARPRTGEGGEPPLSSPSPP
ncbi:MAG: hypothetical protein U0230_13605 [Polyangiales bacterium]